MRKDDRLKTILFCCVTFAISIYIPSTRAQCTIDVREFTSDSPVLLSGDGTDFTYPDESDTALIKLENEEMKIVHCPAEGFIIEKTLVNGKTRYLTCTEKMLRVGDVNADSYSQIHCSQSPSSSTKSTGESCPGGEVIKIDFKISEEVFTSTIDLCFNSKLLKTTWAHHVIPKSLDFNYGNKIEKKPRLKRGKFSDIPVDDVYAQVSQKQHMLKILGEEMLERYNFFKDGNLLTKGRLIAQTNKFYSFEQGSTYHYMNTLPMWHAVNSGNRKVVDNIIRLTARRIGDLHVWVGGLYDLTLENKRIYLAEYKGEPAFVVPKFIFTLVHHVQDNKAMVYVTVNNPFLLVGYEMDDYKICEEDTMCITKEELKDPRSGYTYCCTYDEFMKDRMASSLGLPVLIHPSPLY